MSDSGEVRKALRRRMVSQSPEAQLRDLLLVEVGVLPSSYSLKQRKDRGTGKVLHHLTLDDRVAQQLQLPKCSGFKPIETIHRDIELAIKPAVVIPVDQADEVSA